MLLLFCEVRWTQTQTQTNVGMGETSLIAKKVGVLSIINKMSSNTMFDSLSSDNVVERVCLCAIGYYFEHAQI